MGTEIHAFIEVDYATAGEPFIGETATIRAFNRGEFFICNVDDLLDALGDGRSRHFLPETVKRWAMFPPRGLPPNPSYGVVVRYSHPIADPQSQVRGDQYSHALPGLPEVTAAEAARWVAEGWSHYYTPPAQRYSSGPPPVRVSHPDWRHASWLLLSEVYQALAHFGLGVTRLSPEIEAILGVMEVFERRLGAGRTRLVFWFDN